MISKYNNINKYLLLPRHAHPHPRAGGAVGAARLGVAVPERRSPLLAVLALEEPN